jgi:uncharacterized protein
VYVRLGFQEGFEMFIDPLYLLFMIPALLIGVWAQVTVKRNVKKYSEVPTRNGMTGREIAQAILDSHGLREVRIEPAQGFLGDHYDSRHKVLRLSPHIYNGRSVTAAGVAAHEVGHAIQDAKNYVWLEFRQKVAPAAAIGSNMAWLFLLGGFIMQSAGLIYVGVAVFSLGVIFALVTLPVEFDASARAKRVLAEMGLVSGEEGRGVTKVLNAAAMTYVAAAVSAILTLAYFLIRAGGMSND